MAATTSAAKPAAISSVASSTAIVQGDLVNVPAGKPASPIWPGAVNPVQYTDPGPGYPVEGPVSRAHNPIIPGDIPLADSGGGVLDETYMQGTDAPMVPWDSSAGEPFAPSGALNPALHGQDLGAVAIHQETVPAFIGALRRFSPAGQTYNTEAETQTEKVSFTANGRMNYDQYQTLDPSPGDGGGYAPWDPGYAERPVLLNVAYQATGVSPEANQYGVNGVLPDRSQWNAYQASAYETPAEPVVSQNAPVQQVPQVTGGWLLR